MLLLQTLATETGLFSFLSVLVLTAVESLTCTYLKHTDIVFCVLFEGLDAKSQILRLKRESEDGREGENVTGSLLHRRNRSATASRSRRMFRNVGKREGKFRTYYNWKRDNG